MKAAGGAVPADGSELAGLRESQGAKGKGPRMGTRTHGSRYECHTGMRDKERDHWPTQAFLILWTHLFPSYNAQHLRG